MKLKFRLLILSALIFLSTNVGATTITIRLIKATGSGAAQKAQLYLKTQPSAYRLSAKKWYNGENQREIFFELETENCSFPLEDIEIIAKGVKVSRVIIGRTDVSFKMMNDRYTFKLVADTLDGGHIQTAYQNPKGGPMMWIYHNWEQRTGGLYKGMPYPEKQLAIALNYEIACQEMLRLMKDMSGLNQNFYGELILLNCESAAPRGHLDFPPHWHLQHWEHGHDTEYGIDWRRKQYIIPHYYVDTTGNISYNQQSIRQNGLVIKQPKQKYLPGDTCTWTDSKANLIFKQVIHDGIRFIKPNGEIWHLKPDLNGIDSSVEIYRNEKLLARCSAKDNGERGETQLRYEYFENGKIIDTSIVRFNYDPFTGLLSP